MLYNAAGFNRPPASEGAVTGSLPALRQAPLLENRVALSRSPGEMLRSNTRGNDAEKVESDVTDEISGSASDKGDIQETLVCVVTRNRCRKPVICCHIPEKRWHQAAGCGFCDAVHSAVCFHCHSLACNCLDTLRNSEDKRTTYHLTQFPPAF